ncbi:MAG TPA: protein kinase [Pyrinomonadaceae bacterium]|jgi:serine/threonine-protein kinase|nr:protein kinase [Pyrinomonadaceae bacterium]
MNQEQYERLTELFHAALEIAPDERADFLNQVSDGDADLKYELESLLAAHEQRAAYTQKPPDDIAAGMYLAQQDNTAAGAASLAPNTRIDRYEIRSLLGKGGMGEVYLAEDTILRRLVALKLLPVAASANEDRMRRFVQEARTAAALSHPHIAQIFEVGEYNGTDFIAMELVDGVTLRTKIHSEQTDLRKLLKYLQQVAEGLAKAHAAGIVHRDLKPDNIMITRDGYAKILDFGLAKLIEPERPLGLGRDVSSEVATAIKAQHSLTGMVMGTVGYMSPEQAQGKVKEIDQRSDIFSFGCILFEAVTGQKPFEGQDLLDSLHKIVHAPTPQIKETNASAPNELQRIVRRCLPKDPEERYQTIKDVALELKEVRQGMAGAELDTSGPSSDSTRTLAGQSTEHSTRSTSSTEYIITEIKRRKRDVTVVLAGLILLSLAGIGYFFYFARGGKAIDSIAVLPFLNASGDPNTDYLSDGISETLINSLTQLQQLRVVARSTAFRYKGKEVDPQAVGRDLNVRAVLMGRVRQAGDSLNVQVDLVDATTGAQLWGQEYDRKFSDVVAVKQDIAREVTQKLRLRLSGAEQQQLARRDTANPEAYQLYLKGRYYWNKRTAEGLKRAIEQFQQATDKDPNYALAYVGLADCYLVLEQYAGTPTSETLPKARAAVLRALQIDDSLAEAHASLAQAYKQSWQFEEAGKEFKRAIELNPNYPTAHHWYSQYLVTMGRLDEAVTEIKRAQQLDPLSPVINAAAASTYRQKGDLDAAMEQCKGISELDPTFRFAHACLGGVYQKQGRYGEAIGEFRKAVEASGRASENLSALGHCYAISGRRSEAMATLKELEGKYAKRESAAFNLAAVYAGLGEKDQAFAWLEKDFQSRSGTLFQITFLPTFDTLRSDPRYADLLRRMGLRP